MRRLLPISRFATTRHIAVVALAILVTGGPAFAQSGEPHPQEQPPKQAPAQPTEASKEAPHKVDEFTEAAQAINGPAGNPECVWAGRHVVSLMTNDDVDTAFRHLDLYDRFGCPGGHIQAAFRCLTRFPEIREIIAPKTSEKGDAVSANKQKETLARAVHTCWINPGAQPPQPSAAPPSPAAPAAQAPAQQK